MGANVEKIFANKINAWLSESLMFAYFKLLLVFHLFVDACPWRIGC